MASARSATSAELRAPSWSHLSLIHRHSKSMRLRRSPRFERGSRVASSVRCRRVDLSTGAELNDLKQGRSRTTQPGKTSPASRQRKQRNESARADLYQYMTAAG